MKDYSLYIFDLDGTLYRGDAVILEAVDALARLRRRGKLVRFLTNNSSAAVDAVAAKLRRLGYEADPSEVVTSATVTGGYLVDQGICRVQVIGEVGLVDTLSSLSLHVQAPDDSWNDPADAVVVGICRQLTYAHLAKAMRSIRAGARFIATNADATYPVENDSLIPGAGSIVAAVRTASETEPFIVGKPNPLMTTTVLREAGVRPEDALVIGDRVDTDIESGRAAGCDTLLVLSGVTKVAPPQTEFALSLDVL